MRKMWKDMTDMDAQNCDNEPVSYQSWFASSLLDLQADSCACMQNGSGSLQPPDYVYLNLPGHYLWEISSFCLHAPFGVAEMNIVTSVEKDGNDNTLHR